MSAEVITQIRTADANPRGQGRGGNSNGRVRGGNSTATRGSTRNRNNTRGKKEKNIPNDNHTEPVEQEKSTTTVVATQSETTSGGDSDVCWICAEPVKYYSLSECNHRTCHVCAIRLRALYKKTECTFCKVSFEGFDLYFIVSIDIFLGSTICGYFHCFT